MINCITRPKTVHVTCDQARLYNDFVAVKRSVDRFKGSEKIYPPLSWAQVRCLTMLVSPNFQCEAGAEALTLD